MTDPHTPLRRTSHDSRRLALDQVPNQEQTGLHSGALSVGQNETNSGLSSESNHGPSNAISSTTSPRVQFSGGRDEGNPPSPSTVPTARPTSGDKQGILKKASTWSSTPGMQSSNSSTLVETNVSTPHISPGLSSSRTRTRGYSLRRSLFTQNIHGQADSNEDSVIELHSPASSSTSAGLSDHPPNTGTKRQTSIIVETPLEEEDDFPSNPVRLSDPSYSLPLYRRWVSKQRSHKNVIRLLQAKVKNFRKTLFRTHELPPTIDGRHVVVNVAAPLQNVDERTGRPYISNTIRSCRYTPFNFVPRQLYAQFGKLANFYFLCVSILQMIPGLSTTGTYTTIIPLLIFVGISMAKEGYDDVRRNRLDREENERMALILNDGQSPLNTSAHPPTSVSCSAHETALWRRTMWQDIRVGDVVLMQRDTPAPADIVLLQTESENAIAYFETKSLDGETNLKSKTISPNLRAMCEDAEAIKSFGAVFVAEDPNLDLYKFEGRVVYGDKAIPLTNNEMIYRGSILRNTTRAIGIVIYSGEESKIRMNANKNPRIKAPSMQALVNKVVVIIACMVFALAAFMTVAYQIWRKATEDHAFYLKEARVGFGQIMTSFIIMFNTMLPLSLYVSLEIVKVSQMFLMNDVDMYDAETDTRMEARTSTINEELGQVTYIFSDKTGTLTNNNMRFRKLSVAGTAWLHDQDLLEEATEGGNQEKLIHKKRSARGKGKGRAARKSVNSTTIHTASPNAGRPSTGAEWQPSAGFGQSIQCGKSDEMLQYIQRRPNTLFARKVRLFILSLALCHTCVPEKDEDGNITFQAASPDELALVMAAQDFGYIVVDRQSNEITIKTYPHGEDEPAVYDTYEILHIIEFSSGRKRMSVVVRMPDQRICIFCKGADTTIRSLLRLRDLASMHVGAIARRTSQRKSMEAQEVLRRKSVQLSRKGSFPRTSLASVPSPHLGRTSSVTLGRSRTMRDSVDHWLKDRETDVDLRPQRDSLHHYTPRPSDLVISPTLPRRSIPPASSGNATSPRLSFQTDEPDDLVDDGLVVDDSAVFERCFQHVDDFATEGLRTLLFAHRYINEQDYSTWREVYNAACTSLVDRQDKVERAGAQIEAQLELIGATAIEDKLQKGVPDAIDRFRRAGIKLWMLTGDKRETAINIGHSCRLIKDYSTVIILDHEQGELPSRMTEAVAGINDQRTAHSVLVVDGQTLGLIEADPALKALFTDLAILADSVICCRASPSQKAALVKTIRTKVKGSVTLAVGDGANDIAMIQEAHLGIGIAGKEGLQAARSSDYSIAQFRFLLKLILVHGRWNYVRICKYTLGTFWKEMMFYLVQALYQRWNGYTGTSLYEPWSLSMFNTLFTSLPVIFMGVFEKDLAASTLLAVPELYNLGQHNRGFNIKVYFWWAFLATCEAMIVFFIMYGIYGEALFTRDQELYAMGALAFTACVVIISLKLQVLELHNKSVAAVIAIFLSVGGWWLFNIFLSLVYPLNVVYNVKHGLLDRFGKNLLWWTTLLLTIGAVSMFEVVIRLGRMMLFPTDVDTFQEYEQDREVRKRFEEAASELLQQGWNRGTKRSSMELAREAAVQAEREAQVQALLDRPRTNMREIDSDLGVRRRHSAHGEDGMTALPINDANENIAPRKSVDVADVFSKGFGKVRQEPDLR